jgi:hypothetical protein
MKAKGKIQNPKSKIQNGMVVLLLFCAVGCGYQFSGRGDAFPKDVRTVFVESFVNRTREVGMEKEFTTALRSEFHHWGQLRVVDSPDQADAILSGVVRSYDTRVVGTNRRDEVLQFETAVILDMSFRRRSPDELLWRTQGTRFAELHSGSRGAVVTTSSDFKSRNLNPGDIPQFTDIQLTETFKQETRNRLMERAAHELNLRLMEMF